MALGAPSVMFIRPRLFPSPVFPQAIKDLPVLLLILFYFGSELKTKFHCDIETAVCPFCGLFVLYTRWRFFFSIIRRSLLMRISSYKNQPFIRVRYDNQNSNF